MEHLLFRRLASITANCPRRTRRIVPLIGSTALVLTLFTAGCDSNAFDSGHDYGPREGSAHLPGPPQYWVRLQRTEAKTPHQELLASSDTGMEKVAEIAGSNALVPDAGGMTKTLKDAEPMPLGEDSVSHNFKYNGGYRNPLLPTADGPERESPSAKKLPTDVLEANGLDSTRLDPLGHEYSHYQIATPAGPLGDLERQRQQRERHGETYNPYGSGQRQSATEESDADDGTGSGALIGEAENPE